jgi:hypothetical protein
MRTHPFPPLLFSLSIYFCLRVFAALATTVSKGIFFGNLQSSFIVRMDQPHRSITDHRSPSDPENNEALKLDIKHNSFNGTKYCTSLELKPTVHRQP